MKAAEGWKHPELQEGEVLLCNTREGYVSGLYFWQTKRAGSIAYDFKDVSKVCPGYVPVFVKKSEIEEKRPAGQIIGHVFVPVDFP